MKLYGSLTSPFVRRLRIWMDGLDYEFIHMNIFDSDGREALRSVNPALKIPVLVDDWQAVFDSRVIFNYLNHKLEREVVTVDDENTITLINAANDLLVELLLLQRSGIDIEQDSLFFRLQHERIESVLKVLEVQAGQSGFECWHFPAISLFCLLDWALYRELHHFHDYPQLRAFHQQQLEREVVQQTDPRQSE